VKVAAYQAPLLEPGSNDAFDSIRDAVKACEAQQVDILCCPEAILGGLADYAPNPRARALETSGDRLTRTLTPVASESVTTIIGFSEITAAGVLYNAAAVLHRGEVVGVYRKRHPAIHRSVYAAGRATPVFTIGTLTFGILICNDSNHRDGAAIMAARGATALFIPTNNGLPREKTYAELVGDTRRGDATLAIEHRTWVIRADVVGRTAGLVSDGSSGIVNRRGECIAAPLCNTVGLLVATIEDTVLPE
jgi:predicted amidohydrolase